MNTPERLHGSTHAVLYALNSESGKRAVFERRHHRVFHAFRGIALSNGRVFVSTYDGVVYAFGLKNEER
jgi:outer membrane protein assembly factor BamB